MKNLKVLVFIATMFGFFSSAAYAQTEVAVSGSFNSTGVSTSTLASDCRTQIFNLSFGNVVFGVFCEGDPAPKVVIATFCSNANVLDPDYSVSCQSSNRFTIRRTI
jgi:hypothetical protein